MRTLRLTPRQGKAYLIGAGPGRADLITVRGLTLLRRADVVIYDRLIPEGALDVCRPDAELIYVGKKPVKFNIPQTEAVERLKDLIKEHGKWIEPASVPAGSTAP